MAADHPDATGLTARARALWERLAGNAAKFASAVSVTVSPRSALCPSGWAGIVVVGDAALATAPDQATARLIEQALGGQPAASLADTAQLERLLPAGQLLGPAALAYLHPADFRSWSGPAVTPLELDDPGLRRFLVTASPGDLEESGLQEITTPAFAIREHDQVVAAAGYRDWPLRTAHLSVLTAAGARGRGLGRAAAAAAAARALERGQLPQWRARPETSRRVARALGFRELGCQVSIRPGN